MAAKQVILDTDIGSDVDDALALALLVKSPELRLVGVTTVYGDVDLRARMARKLLDLAGRQDVPVCAGVRLPLLRKRPVWWAGHEGQGLLDEGDRDLAYDPRHAVDFIIETARAYPGQITLLPIGPLTNIATALTCEPKLPDLLAGIVLMGGVVRAYEGLSLPWVEHNIKCDPEAAAIVLGCGAKITMVPLDVTMRVAIDRTGLERVRAAGTPFHLAVAEQLARYPRFAARGSTFTHDPLAVAVAVDHTFCQHETLRVQVETIGEFTAGATVSSSPSEGDPAVSVCVAVDSRRFERFLVDRIAS